MKNTLYKGYLGSRMPRNIQLQRVKNVIANELTPLQQRTLTAYYLEEKTMADIARERGVDISTVCRTLHRAENRLRRFLRY